MLDSEKHIMQICDNISKEEWYISLQDELILLQQLVPDNIKLVFDRCLMIVENINQKTMDEVYLQALDYGRKANKN